MADCVKDSILTNDFEDLVLLRLVELALSAERSGRTLSPSLLGEPAFFHRHFQPWVREAIEERSRLEALERETALDIEQ